MIGYYLFASRFDGKPLSQEDITELSQYIIQKEKLKGEGLIPLDISSLRVSDSPLENTFSINL